MSAQDKTEEILRQMHILLAGSEAYDSIGSKIILDKKRMLELLAELNKAIYAMLDEYELTTRGKERARREAAKIGEDILKDASGKAEDVYAASVMYTNEHCGMYRKSCRGQRMPCRRFIRMPMKNFRKKKML